jgi:hypothetical protein
MTSSIRRILIHPRRPTAIARFRTLTGDLPPIRGRESLNVPICPVLPFAARRGSRNYAIGQPEPGSNCSQTASVPLGKGATQCRAKHCTERPVPDRGQALGVRFLWRHATRTSPGLAVTILIPRRRVLLNAFSAARTSCQLSRQLHNLGRPFPLRGLWLL